MIIGPFNTMQAFARDAHRMNLPPDLALVRDLELDDHARRESARLQLHIQPENLLGEYLVVPMRRAACSYQREQYQVERNHLYCLSSREDVLAAATKMIERIGGRGPGLLWHLERLVHYVPNVDSDTIMGAEVYGSGERLLLLRSFFGHMPMHLAAETGRLRSDSRAEKIARARAGLARGEHLAQPIDRAFGHAPIIDALTRMSTREEFAQLGGALVHFDGGMAAFCVEFPRVRRKAHFDPDLFRIVGWEPAVHFELRALLDAHAHGVERAEDETNAMAMDRHPTLDWLASFRAFEAAQRDGGPIALTENQRKAASAEWSHRLRGRVAASADRERNQVLVDLQDEP